jgi:hypothetical protein
MMSFKITFRSQLNEIQQKIPLNDNDEEINFLRFFLLHAAF